MWIETPNSCFDLGNFNKFHKSWGKQASTEKGEEPEWLIILEGGCRDRETYSSERLVYKTKEERDKSYETLVAAVKAQELK